MDFKSIWQYITSSSIPFSSFCLYIFFYSLIDNGDLLIQSIASDMDSCQQKGKSPEPYVQQTL